MNTRLIAQPTAPGNRARPWTANRGAVLMVALVLSAIVAVALTSYIRLSLQAAKMSNRSFYMDGAQNLADLGLEHVLWSMNNGNNWAGAGFGLRSGTTNQYQATFPTSGTYYNFSGGVRGQVKVWVDVSSSATPHAVVQSVITLNDGSTLSKTIEAYFKARSYFEDGIVGNTLDMNGTVDSWDSDPDRDGSASGANALYAYSSGIAHANAKIAATGIQPADADVGQADIKGYAAAGSSDTGGGITVGKQGSVGDAAWVASKNGIQDGHATYDFTASFPDATFPTVPSTSSTGTAYTAITLTGADTTLPGATDPMAADGKYYYYINQVSLSGNSDEMHIDPNKKVVLMVTGNVSVTGSCPGITIATGSQLQLYTPGDVSVHGNGLTNGTSSASANTVNQPINFQLYGTRAASAGTYQSIAIGCNRYLSGVVYAPNANVTVNGNGHVLGATVAHNVRFAGTNVQFHIDESLADTITTGLWKLRKWRELAMASEQAAYSAQLSF